MVENRKTAADLLRQASVFTLVNKNLEEPFIQGACDIEIAQLDMDSLAIMEICIALEMNHGMSIRPEDLLKVGTLGMLATKMGGAGS